MFQHQEQTDSGGAASASSKKTTSTGAGRRVLRAVPTSPIQSQAAYIPMPDREDVDGERTKSIFSTRGTRREKMDVDVDHVEQAQGQAQAGMKVISAEEGADLLSAANPRLTLFYLALQTFTIGAPLYGFISSLGKLDLAPRVHPTDVVPSYTVTTFLIMLRTSQIAAFPVSYLVDVMGGRIGSLCASALVALGAFSLSYSVASAAEGPWALDPDPGLRPLFVLAAVCFGLSACFQIVSVMLSLRTLFSFAFSQFAVTLLNGCFDSSAIMFTLVGTVSLAVSHELGEAEGVDGEELHLTNANAFSAGLVIYGCVALAHFFGAKWLYPRSAGAGADEHESCAEDPKLREKSKINTATSLLTRASRTIAEWSPRLMMPHGDHSGASEISTTGPPTPEELLASGFLSTKSPTPSSLATPLLSGKISSFSSSELRDEGEETGHLQQDIILSVPHEVDSEKQSHNMNFGCPPPGGGLQLETTPWRTWVTLRPGKKDVTLSFWKTLLDRDYLLSILWFAVQFQNFTNYLTQMPDIFAPQVLNVSGYFYPVSIITACILGTAFNYVQNPSLVVCTTTASGLLFQTMVYWLVCDVAASAGAVVEGAAGVVPPQGPNPGMTSTLADGVGDQSGVGLHPSAPEISHGPHQQLPPRPPTTPAPPTTPVEETSQNVKNLPLQFAVLLFLPFFRSGLFSTMWIYWPWVWQGSSHIGAMYGFATFFSFLFSSFLIAFVLLPRHGPDGTEAVAMNEQWMQIYATVSILYSVYAVATHEYRTRVGGGSRELCSS
mmetsp:Transcript_12765/g.31014  ORF Transcript_12765/g.31014 Transcript_12765/m.31014 type:complete len:778 (+) Transcript_12765:314-2647(+)